MSERNSTCKHHWDFRMWIGTTPWRPAGGRRPGWTRSRRGLSRTLRVSFSWVWSFPGVSAGTWRSRCLHQKGQGNQQCLRREGGDQLVNPELTWLWLCWSSGQMLWRRERKKGREIGRERERERMRIRISSYIVWLSYQHSSWWWWLVGDTWSVSSWRTSMGREVEQR